MCRIEIASSSCIVIRISPCDHNNQLHHHHYYHHQHPTTTRKPEAAVVIVFGDAAHAFCTYYSRPLRTCNQIERSFTSLFVLQANRCHFRRDQKPPPRPQSHSTVQTAICQITTDSIFALRFWLVFLCRLRPDMMHCAMPCTTN